VTFFHLSTDGINWHTGLIGLCCIPWFAAGGEDVVDHWRCGGECADSTAVLVSVASRRDDSEWTLAGPAPGLSQAAALRILDCTPKASARAERE
jgi:hypothetical protein